MNITDSEYINIVKLQMQKDPKISFHPLEDSMLPECDKPDSASMD